MSIRPLSKVLQEVAIKELDEEPKRIPEDLANIKTWLSQQKHIRARVDDQWLLCFLRGCKYSLERTKEKLDFYYTMKTMVPEYMQNRDPMSPEIQRILDLGLYLPLPTLASPDSPVVILFRTGIYDVNKFNVADVMKVNMMFSTVLMLENDNFNVVGGQMIQDMAKLTMAHITAMSPAMTKKATTIFQDAFPVRPKGLHFCNIPTFFDILFAIFKPFLKEKMLNRVSVHSTKNIGDLYKLIPRKLMPKEYGGEAAPCAEIAAIWKKKMESYREWFIEDDKYGTDETKRPGKPKTTENIFGLEGSFRKLNVD